MNAPGRDDDLARCDGLSHSGALGNNAGHAPAVEQDAHHARIAHDFEIGPRPRLGGEIAVRAGGALMVLAERRRKEAVLSVS